MKKRTLIYAVVLLIGIAVGSTFQPFSYVTSFGQAGCQTFPQTGKQICGRFLDYWTKNGGLTQQGLPLSGEFTEVSTLNGKSYTVQYFERAVFEKHPENAAPYDVLLSQLGTFQFKTKYPNGEPGGGTGNTLPVVPTQTPAANVPNTSTSDGLVAVLKAAGLPVAETTVYTVETDPNHLLGRPNQYTGKASWHDTRLPAPTNAQKVEVSDGGGVEIWPDAASAQTRADYIANIGKNLPALVEYDYVLGKVLLRVSKDLTPDQASAYKAALQKAGVK